MNREQSDMSGSRVMVLWTGGKDSCLALHEVAAAGCEIAGLVTLVPPAGRFRAHPVEFLIRQAEAMDLPYRTIEIRPPYREGYEQALRDLRERDGIAAVVTGDIAEVDGQPNWIRQCATPAGLGVHTPLWHASREELMLRITEADYRVMLSCVKQPWFDASWLGREWTDPKIRRELQTMHEQTGLDICGENGEFHTLVTDAPMFRHRLSVGRYDVEEIDGVYSMRFEAIDTQPK